ncbi:MAG: DUF1622 domain-containing protein [Candidatus Velthaea sp.]
MESLFRSTTVGLASYIEAGAALIIGYAAVEALVGTAALIVRRRIGEVAKDDVRLRLGRWLSVALEFELAADILRTAVTPTWNDLGKLAAIVVIRTAINFFLQQEIDKAARTPA